MWLANQFVAFVRRNREGYAWGLAYESLGVGLDTADPNATLQLWVGFRNVTRRPIEYHVERFDVVVGNRTPANPKFVNSGGVIPVATQRQFRGPAFPQKDIAGLLGKKASGIVELSVAYGAPSRSPVRRLTMRLDVAINLTPGSVSQAHVIISEADEPI